MGFPIQLTERNLKERGSPQQRALFETQDSYESTIPFKDFLRKITAFPDASLESSQTSNEATGSHRIQVETRTLECIP